MKQFKPFLCENEASECVRGLGGDEGKQAASAETQSHREGKSERQAGKKQQRE